MMPPFISKKVKILNRHHFIELVKYGKYSGDDETKQHTWHKRSQGNRETVMESFELWCITSNDQGNIGIQRSDCSWLTDKRKYV